MSNKLKKLLFTLVIALLVLPMFGGSVLAAESDEKLDYVMVMDYKNVEFSSKYFDEKVVVTEKNGIKYIKINFYDADENIAALSIQGQEFDFHRNEDNTGYIEYRVDGEITENIALLNMKIDTKHPIMGIMDHTTRIFLGVTSMDEISPELLESTLVVEEPEIKEPEPEVVYEEGIISENGYYTIDASYLKIDNDDSSAMNNFIASEAFLSAKDGKVELTLAFANDYITKLQIEGQDGKVAKVDGATRYETFTFENLANVYEAYVDYQMGTHVSNADFRILFDEETLADAESTNQFDAKYVAKPIPGRPAPTEPVEPDDKPVEPSKPEAEVKTEDIKYVVKHETEDKTSAADGFFLKPATLITKDGVNYLQLTISNWSMVNYLKTVDGDVEIIAENVDGSAKVQFKIGENLSETIMLDMSITVPGMYENMKHKARLILDTGNPEEPEEPEEPKKKIEPTLSKKEKPEVKVEKPNQLIPDKAYTVNYVIKHATEDRESAANQFFTNNAVLLTKNGVNYLQLTVANWSMVDSLRTSQGEATVIRENSDGSALIQLRVNKDLSAPVVLSMTVTVPGMYESMEHEARLFIDESTLKEVNVGDHKIAAASNGNGIIVNPQTGENSNLLLLTLLLIGSGSVIAYAVRKRFVA